MSKRGDHGARLMTENDARYFAGILDGEGWIDCRRRLKRCPNKKFYKCSSIHVEIQMNHKGVMDWIAEKTGYGTLLLHKATAKQNHDSWRWRCCFRDAYKLAKTILPFSIVKKETLQRIVDHYEH